MGTCNADPGPSEYQTLGLNEPGPDPVLLRRAQRVLSGMSPLRRAVRRCRAAVITITGKWTKVDDDLPF
jgi:hypothetical protein